MEGFWKLIGVLLLSVPFSVHAEVDQGGASSHLRESGNTAHPVRNVFLPTSNIFGDRWEVEYFPARHVSKSEEEEEKVVEPEEAEQAKEEKVSPEKEMGDRKVLESKDEILEKYGDPNADRPVLAQTDAPEPFQGMMQSLQVGDSQLAFSYARQYVRYLRDLRARNQRVSGMLAMALESEGLADGKGWTASEKYEVYRELQKKDEEQRKAIEEGESLLADLDPGAQELVSKASKLEQVARVNEGGFQEPSIKAEVGLSEKERREQIRASLRNNVPVDPSGKVAVKVFLRPNDKKSQSMAAVFEALWQRSRNDPKLEFIAMSFEPEVTQDFQEYRRKTRTTFPIMDGSVLVKSMKLRVSPTTVFSTIETNESVFEKGAGRPFFYFDELVNVMQGKDQGRK